MVQWPGGKPEAYDNNGTPKGGMVEYRGRLFHLVDALDLAAFNWDSEVGKEQIQRGKRVVALTLQVGRQTISS